jgi:hypothetical protein
MALNRHRPDHRSEPPPWRAPPYREIQKRIGAVLRKQYEPPKDLPPQMLTLLRQMDETEDDDS